MFFSLIFICFFFMAYKSGEGNVFVTMFGNVSLCKTNKEIKSPDFLFICTNKLRSVFGD